MNVLSTSSLGCDGLRAPLEAASDALARLDERLLSVLLKNCNLKP